MEDYLIVKSGDKIYYKINKVKESKATVIINHGFAEHLDRYDYVAHRLNEAGFSVYRYDLRGHGRSGTKSGHIDSYEDFLFDCREMVKFIKSQTDDKLYMLGHSMGGFVTCLYGIKFPNDLSGQIFSGAAVAPLPSAKGYKARLFKFANKFFKNMMIANPVDNDICSDIEVVKHYREDPLILKKATLNFYVEFLVNGIEYVNENIEKYKYPCLILQGEEDRIVPKEVAEYLHKSISSTDKEIKIYKGLYHEILNEKVKDQIIDDVIFWLNNRI